MDTVSQGVRALGAALALGLLFGLGGCAGASASTAVPAAPQEDEEALAAAGPCERDCEEIRRLCLRKLTVPSAVPEGVQGTAPPPVEADPGDLATEARCNRTYRDCRATCEERGTASEEVAPY